MHVFLDWLRRKVTVLSEGNCRVMFRVSDCAMLECCRSNYHWTFSSCQHWCCFALL